MDIVFKKDSSNKTNEKTSIKESLVKFLKNYDSNFYFFLVLVVMGVIFMASTLFTNQFTTLFGGDYTAQQLPFYTNGYDDWWHFFKTGEFRFFDTNTFLGASNVGANSFYYFFDPFFLPILLCPREYIAQGMAILSIFKIATAGMFFMQYMKVMGASKKASRISAFTYAFSGWMAWFLWFNHMTEVMIVFPLILWGVERILRDKKPWLLMFALFLMGITNYFFLVGMGIAGFFYAMFRFFQRLPQFKTKDNLQFLGIGFIGFATGILLACCVALPAALYSLDAPRATNSSYLETIKNSLLSKDFERFFKLLFSWKETGEGAYKHYYPLTSFVYPCASCRGTPLVSWGQEYYDNCATNIFTYIPMLLFFLPAFINAMKEKRWSVLVATVLFIVALETPFAYYLFFGFTAPYGRWELFFITSFITFVGLYIDKVKEQPIWMDIASYVFVLALAIGGALCAEALLKSDVWIKFQLRNEDLPIAGACAILCVYVTIVFLIILFTKKKKSFHKAISVLVAFEATVMGYLTIQGHWCGSFIDANNGLTYNNDIYQLNQQIVKKDKSFYRIWTYNQNESGRNDGMRNDYNGLGCFHSLYNFNLNNFLNWTKVQDNDTFSGGGSWASSYVWKNTDLDKFLGVKYYFIQANYPQFGWLQNGGVIDDDHPFQYNVPLDYERIYQYQTNHYAVYEDKKFTDFGYAYDSLISYELEEESNVQAENTVNMPYSNSKDVLRNDEMLLEGAIVDQDTAAYLNFKYPNLTITNAPEIRGIKKHVLSDVSGKNFDLHASTSGEKYTVNTFFENYANAYLEGIHALTSDKLVRVDEGDFLQVSSNDVSTAESTIRTAINNGEPVSNSLYGRYVVTLTPNYTNTFEECYDEKGYAIYVPYQYSDDYQADIYLVDEDYKVITWDRFQDDKYTIGGTKYRGLYVHPLASDELGNVTKPAPKLKKIIICNRNRYAKSSLYFSNIYYEKYGEQQDRLATTYTNTIENVRFDTTAKFTFRTNFDSNKVIVSRMPFEKGWKVKAVLNDGTKKYIDVFSAQGGFASFVSEKGLTEYTMTFYPDYLDTGKYLSAMGALIFLVTFYGYCFFVKEEEKRKQEHLTFNFK